ncbi:MAG: pirin family protein [Kofleriaceae bacterium]|nr:pirin family protein [Kofleriaceae bacterium]
MVAIARNATIARPLLHRTSGWKQGPITRLVSPGDLGQLIKPFVFLDYFETPRSHGRGFPAHPHSGIATHSTLLEGTFSYGDSTGKAGTMRAGDLEWMQAGGGVWHWGHAVTDQPVRGYQLWIALPPALETAPAESDYLTAGQVPVEGPARVLLGKFGEHASPLPYREDVTYLHVKLLDGERWTYVPAPTHDVAWLATHRGALQVSGTRLERELAIFAPGPAPIEIEAIGDSELVIGSAVKHPHALVTGSYSVHSSRAALLQGERGIDALENMPLVQRALGRR